MSLWQEFRDSLSSVISFPADYFAGWFGVAPSESGVEVNELTALQLSAFVACVRLISSTVGCTPLNVYELTSDGEKLAPNHPLQRVLAQQPNPEATAADVRQTGQGHLLTTGNCYLEIAHNAAGQPAALFLRNPYRTIPYRAVTGDISNTGMNVGDIFYKTNDSPSGYERIILAENMVHVKNFGMDSLVGLSPVKYYMREVLGNDLAAQSFSAKYFANASAPDGYLKTAAVMTGDRKKEAIQSWMAGHSRGNAHRMAILDSGMTWEKVGVTPDEAQFIQTRGWNAKQIGMMFGVPMHFLGDSEQSRANMEQRSIEFLIFTMRSWYDKWEQSLNMKLFPSVGRNAGKFYCRFDTSFLERATYADLLRGVQMGRYAGLYTADEGRKALGLQPYTKAQLDSLDPGDKLLRPVNMVYVTADDIEDPTAPSPDGGEGQGGDDQSGGNGAGKVPSPTTQGGKRTAKQRSDAEIKRYFVLFYPTFRDALGRIMARNKPDGRDFQRVFSPVLIQIASAFSFRPEAPPSDMALSESNTQFVQDYISALALRAADWTPDQADVIAMEEIQRALKALREKCSVVSEEEPEGEPEAEEDDHRITVNIAPPEIHFAPNITMENKPVKKQGRMLRQADGSMGFEIQESSTTVLRASREPDGAVVIASEEKN